MKAQAATLDATATWSGRLRSERYHIVVEKGGEPVAACNRSYPVNEDWSRAAEEIDRHDRCMKSGCRQRWPKEK